MFRGRVFKDGKLWIIEVPDLDLATQGHTREDAYGMLVDLLRTSMDRPAFKADIRRYGDGTFLLGGSGERAEGALTALFLRRQRVKAGLSLSDMARLLGAKSRNAYARYEHGESLPGPLMMKRILNAMGLCLEVRVHRHGGDTESDAA